MSTKYNYARDVSGAYQFALPIPYDNYAGHLAANTAQSITVPANYPYWVAIIKTDKAMNIWVDNTTTAVVPNSSFALSTAQCNPQEVYVKGGSTLSIITDTSGGGNLSVSFYVTNFYVN